MITHSGDDLEESKRYFKKAVVKLGRERPHGPSFSTFVYASFSFRDVNLTLPELCS